VQENLSEEKENDNLDSRTRQHRNAVKEIDFPIFEEINKDLPDKFENNMKYGLF
jgi:hypothetical protein